MSKQYDDYLKEHIENVDKAYKWLINNFNKEYDISYNFNIANHDKSKYSEEEYSQYDAYFYGKKTTEVKEDFNRAWLHHIHNNPHHWQYWVLLEDDPETKENYLCIEIPIKYVFEMIADWWSFSWKTGNLDEIFDWYDKHKNVIKLHKDTRKVVEDILEKISNKLIDSGKEIVHRMVMIDDAVL